MIRMEMISSERALNESDMLFIYLFSLPLTTPWPSHVLLTVDYNFSSKLCLLFKAKLIQIFWLVTTWIYYLGSERWNLPLLNYTWHFKFKSLCKRQTSSICNFSHYIYSIILCIYAFCIIIKGFCHLTR